MFTKLSSSSAILVFDSNDVVDGSVDVFFISFCDGYSQFFENIVQVPKIACHYDLNITPFSFFQAILDFL